MVLFATKTLELITWMCCAGDEVEVFGIKYILFQRFQFIIAQIQFTKQK